MYVGHSGRGYGGPGGGPGRGASWEDVGERRGFPREKRYCKAERIVFEVLSPTTIKLSRVKAISMAAVCIYANVCGTDR